MDFKTIILRFRDLDVPDDDTIRRHNNLISENGYVWWAWWKKGNERTPQDAFAILNTQAQNEPVFVYLLDSGLNKLYKAKCVEIKVNKNAIHYNYSSF